MGMMRTGRVNWKMKNSGMGNLRIQVVKRILHRRRLMMELRTKWHQPQRLSVANVEVQRPMERQYTLAQQVDLVGNAKNMEVRRRRKESQLLHHVQPEEDAHTQRARRRSRDKFVPQGRIREWAISRLHFYMSWLMVLIAMASIIA